MNYSRKFEHALKPVEPLTGEKDNSFSPNDIQLLRSREAAAFLAISSRKLWELQRGGVIPVVRFGRMVRFVRADLEQWVMQNRSSKK